MAQNSAGFELAPYKRERMRLERQMQGAIVLDDVLARPHRRQRDVRFELVHAHASEQRQVVLVAAALQRTHGP